MEDKDITLILTRWNLQYEPNESIGISSQWLNTRYPLFEKYCLPSIQAQTDQDFIWLIFLDERTPMEHRKQMEKYIEICPQIQLHYAPFYPTISDLFTEVGQQFAPTNGHLISIRLDSDDMLFPTYVEQSKKIASRVQQNTIVSFPHGVQLFTKWGLELQSNWLNNHFLVFIENDGVRTSLGYDHTQIKSDEILAVNTLEPMWREVVHSGNICNDFNPTTISYSGTFQWTIGLLTLRFWLQRIRRFGQRLVVGSHQ